LAFDSVPGRVISRAAVGVVMRQHYPWNLATQTF
jgi:hypothetical protein